MNEFNIQQLNILKNFEVGTGEVLSAKKEGDQVVFKPVSWGGRIWIALGALFGKSEALANIKALNLAQKINDFIESNKSSLSPEDKESLSEKITKLKEHYISHARGNDAEIGKTSDAFNKAHLKLQSLPAQIVGGAVNAANKAVGVVKGVLGNLAEQTESLKLDAEKLKGQVTKEAKRLKKKAKKEIENLTQDSSQSPIERKAKKVGKKIGGKVKKMTKKVKNLAQDPAKLEKDVQKIGKNALKGAKDLGEKLDDYIR